MTAPRIWTQTVSGRAVELIDPVAEMIDFDDIAHGLAHINRYSGQTLRPVSVAFHTLLGLTMADEALAPYWRLHDAREAYPADITTPMKQALADLSFTSEDSLRFIQSKLDIAIREASGLRPRNFITLKALAAIKALDLRCLATERRDFLVPSPPPGRAVL